MGHANTQTLGIPLASSDGKFYSRYPQGDKFGVFGDAQGALVTVSAVSPVAVATENTGLINGDSFIVTGSGFGTKTGSGPTIWDHGQAADGTLDPQWTNALPNIGNPSSSNTKNRNTPFNGGGGASTINSPHPYTPRILAGKHQVGGYDGGRNVGPWITFTRPASVYYSTWIYYQRFDPNWVFSVPGNTQLGDDNNQKTYDYATNAPYNPINLNWYDSVWDGSTGVTSKNGYGGQYILNDDGGMGDPTPNASLTNPNNPASPSQFYGDESYNQWGHGWIKMMRFMKFTASADGFVKIYEVTNTGLTLAGNYIQTTDRWSGNTRTEMIGGYSREPEFGPQGQGAVPNWRYLADLYNDRQVSNPGVWVMTNNASLAASTIIEPQIWTAWSDGSVTLTHWRGALPSGLGHLHYINPVTGNQYKGTRPLA